MRSCGTLSMRAVLAAAAAAALLAAGALTPARAASATDIRAGRLQAEKACAGCHALPPPARNAGGAPSGPPFVEIAEGGKGAPDALRSFLVSTGSTVSHPGSMPHPTLSEEQIRLIAAYVASLRQGQ